VSQGPSFSIATTANGRVQFEANAKESEREKGKKESFDRMQIIFKC